MKKLILSFIMLAVIFLISFSAVASEVELHDAKKVAKNFYYERMHQYMEGIPFNEIKIKETIVRKEGNQVVYYAFNLINGGFVIISGEDAYTPVIGYAYEGVFPEPGLSENYASFMQSYADMINDIRDNQLQARQGIKDKWSKYLMHDIDALDLQKGDRDVAPLTSAMWHQVNPYNIYCPYKDGVQCKVGCGATAAAIIMYYYRYPLVGEGENTYSPNSLEDTLYANFGETIYAWDGMQDDIDQNNPHAIAELGYHIGISQYQKYCYNGQNTSMPGTNNPGFWHDHWNYDEVILLWRSGFSTEIWEDTLRYQLDNGWPVFYRGRDDQNIGHLFVCDGYQGDEFHFNFGWAGYANGYYSIDDPYGYSNQHYMEVNIYPTYPGYPCHAQGDSVLTYTSGSFTDGSGPIENYLDNQTATWLIDPQNIHDSITIIELSFTHFDLQAGDYVRVYDGAGTSDPLIGEFTGSELPEVLTSTGNKLFVAFETDGNGTAAGFKAEYNSEIPIWCNGTVTLTEPTGIITDGSGSFFYNHNATCMYMIMPEYANEITLYFNSFEVADSMDVFEVYDGTTIIAGFSTVNPPVTISATSGIMIIKWRTNSIGNAPGWEVYYEIDNVGINEIDAFGELYVYPNPFTSTTALSYTLDKPTIVTIRIFNSQGQQVTEIVQEQTKGKQQVQWNAEGLPGGMYYFRIHAGDMVGGGKMVLMR